MSEHLSHIHNEWDLLSPWLAGILDRTMGELAIFNTVHRSDLQDLILFLLNVIRFCLFFFLTSWTWIILNLDDFCKEQIYGHSFKNKNKQKKKPIKICPSKLEKKNVMRDQSTKVAEYGTPMACSSPWKETANNLAKTVRINLIWKLVKGFQ